MVQYDHIPQELKDREQWVVWKYEEKGEGRATKVPYDPVTAERASSTNPKTWDSYINAYNCSQLPGWDGIGFVFTAEDPYIGVDLDDCYNAMTGRGYEAMTDLEAGWVEDLDSYTEVSPSGKGVKVIFRGQLPKDQDRHSWGGNGIYDRGRFFTITGEVISRQHSVIRSVAPDTLNALLRVWFPPVTLAREVEEQPQRLTDTEVLRMVQYAGNVDKFNDLWAGKWEEWYPSQSDADAGLIGLLAFYTGPCFGQLDRMFRKSGLMRDKWDERRGFGTYGGNTIAMVLGRMDTFWEDDMAVRGIVGPNPGEGTLYTNIQLGPLTIEEVKVPSPQEQKRRWRRLQEGYEAPTEWPWHLSQVMAHVAPMAERLGPDWVALKSLSFLSALCGEVQIENRPLGIWTLGISTQGTGKSATSDELEKVVRGVASRLSNNLSTFTGGSEAGLVRLIAGTRRNVLSYLSEWSGFAKLLETEHSSRMRELLLNVWDGRDYTHTLATEVFQVREPFMVVNGVTTPSSWKRAVDYGDTGNGFYSRFLFVCPDVLPASSDEYPYRTRAQRDLVVGELYEHFNWLSEQHISLATLDAKPSPALKAYSEYLGLSRTNDAIDLDEVGYGSEDQGNGLPGTRLREYVKRLATVLELLEKQPQLRPNPLDAEGKRTNVLRVREANVERAVKLVQRSAAYAQRCYGWLARSKDDEQATVIRLALAARSDSVYGLVSRTGLNGSDVQRALDLLASEGLVSTVADGERRIWSLNGGH